MFHSSSAAAAGIFVRAARKAGLRYSDDTAPGITRTGSPGRFRYLDARGRRVRDPATLHRIRQLAIPPAWTDVWISSSPRGHIQARGRDARGRKQYRYHDDWRSTRDQAKFADLVSFAAALPALRRAVRRDLLRRRLGRDKVVAATIRLLELSLIRIGNEEYARQNRSYGLTTLRDHHATVSGRTLRLNFPGKSGVRHRVKLQDATLARVVQRAQDLPGQELFQYVDSDGKRHRLRSDDVNRYLRRHTGGPFTTKTFRTWAGTVWAAVALSHLPPPGSPTRVKRHVLAAIRIVAERLRNTPAVCRSSYIHPAVLDAYVAGTDILPRRAARFQRFADATDATGTRHPALPPPHHAHEEAVGRTVPVSRGSTGRLAPLAAVRPFFCLRLPTNSGLPRNAPSRFVERAWNRRSSQSCSGAWRTPSGSRPCWNAP